jgi:hypothetical protein
MSTYNEANNYAWLAVYGEPYMGSLEGTDGYAADIARRPEGTPLGGGVLIFRHFEDSTKTRRVDLTGMTARHETWCGLAAEIEHIINCGYDLDYKTLPCRTYVIYNSVVSAADGGDGGSIQEFQAPSIEHLIRQVKARNWSDTDISAGIAAQANEDFGSVVLFYPDGRISVRQDGKEIFVTIN